MSQSRKNSFILYTDQREFLEDLSREERGDLFEALFLYAESGEIPSFDDRALMLAFKLFKSRLDHDKEKYKETCQKNAENQKRRWEKIKERMRTNEYDRIGTNTNGTDNDNDNDNELQESKDSMSNIKKKRDNKLSPKKGKFDVFDLSYCDEKFKELWEGWIKYKGEIKKQYHTETGVKTAYNKLVKLSGGDVAKAKAILGKSYENEWQGFFELRDWSPPSDEDTLSKFYETHTAEEEAEIYGLVPNEFALLDEKQKNYWRNENKGKLKKWIDEHGLS